jgi:hypothetical protein
MSASRAGWSARLDPRGPIDITAATDSSAADEVARFVRSHAMLMAYDLHFKNRAYHKPLDFWKRLPHFSHIQLPGT